MLTSKDYWYKLSLEAKKTKKKDAPGAAPAGMQPYGYYDFRTTALRTVR